MNIRLSQTLKRVLIHILLITGAFLLQTGVFPLLPFLSSTPNLLLILTFSLGFIYGAETGMLCGVAAGLLMDLSSGGMFGFYILIFLYIGYLNGLFTKYYYDDFITLPLILCALNELLYHLYIYAVRFLVRGKLDLPHYFMDIILPEILFSLIVTLFVYRFLLLANKKLDRIQNRRGQRLA